MKVFNLQRILSRFSFGYFRYMISVKTRKSPFSSCFYYSDVSASLPWSACPRIFRFT